MYAKKKNLLLMNLFLMADSSYPAPVPSRSSPNSFLWSVEQRHTWNATPISLWRNMGVQIKAWYYRLPVETVASRGFYAWLAHAEVALMKAVMSANFESTFQHRTGVARNKRNMDCCSHLWRELCEVKLYWATFILSKVIRRAPAKKFQVVGQ